MVKEIIIGITAFVLLFIIDISVGLSGNYVHIPYGLISLLLGLLSSRVISLSIVCLIMLNATLVVIGLILHSINTVTQLSATYQYEWASSVIMTVIKLIIIGSISYCLGYWVRRLYREKLVI